MIPDDYEDAEEYVAPKLIDGVWHHERVPAHVLLDLDGRYAFHATMSWAAILVAMILDHLFADTSDRWHQAVWMAAKTTPMGFQSGAYPALWVLNK